MKKHFVFLFILSFILLPISAQHIEFEEYNLSNGLHVILQQDKSAPVITTSVMYHVGAKDEEPGRTGFAHFFEHLLFEGTENIGRGEWFKIVSSNGGSNNANTSDDRTYYYETFPSNNLQLALWMESERMFHPIINQIGVDTQREVVKEEKRLRVDNSPYGRLWEAIKKNLFTIHPYRWTPIGSMDDLNAASLDEFKIFFKKYYVPNNAVLTVAGDFDKAQTKEWINDYFKDIPRGADIERKQYVEKPIEVQINAIFEDPNIQLPMLVNAYRMPSMKTRDAYALNMISSLLSDGKSSRLYKRLVDQEKIALETASFNMGEEDYSTYVIYAIPITGKTMQDLQVIIDEEITRLCNDLISEKEYEKLQNVFENGFINDNDTSEDVAHNLATCYLLYGDTNLINSKINIYHSITREELKEIANRYLKTNQRLVLDYIPATK